MCGICGEFSFGGVALSTATTKKMSQSLAKRGPDATGIWATPKVVFGHRRLQIVDLSEHSAQPMVDNSLKLTIVYNGMLYNYRQLKDELEKKGYRFISTGDTEVVLKSFAEWGPLCVKKFNGMFAFAIYEHDSDRLTLARDRLGIKPLYYSRLPGKLRFASTLPALLVDGEIDTRLDPLGLHSYFTLHAITPPPHTILRGVHKLPPATIVTYEPDGQKKMTTYWKLEFPVESNSRTSMEWEDILLEALRKSVKRRMLADVPVGILLSGGLDSSLITALLSEAGQELQTFSIGFEGTREEPGDEFRYSDLIANKFGTKHTKIEVDSDRTLSALPEAIAAMSEPMVSHDCVGFHLLASEVAKNLKVVQSGQGADEVFAGYSWYQSLKNSDAPLADYASLFFDHTHAELTNLLTPGYLANSNFTLEFVTDNFAHLGAETAVTKALRIDQTVMLTEDPVKRLDNFTMAHGVEARVPFLDHELVELAANIPENLKLADGGKGILKSLARKILPQEVIDRPKGYFPVPALKYIRGPYLEFVREALHSPTARRRGVFRTDIIEKLLAEPDQHITPLQGNKLWQIALLELWLQENKIG